MRKKDNRKQGKVTRTIRVGAACLFALLFALLLAGCEAKVGERCDGFFKNTCKAPASCVKTQKGKVCANSCSMGKCQKGFKPAQAQVKGLAAGCLCIPENM